jgi:hypothetical protein
MEKKIEPLWNFGVAHIVNNNAKHLKIVLSGTNPGIIIIENAFV